MQVLDQNVKEENDVEFVSMEEVAEEQSKEVLIVEQLLDEILHDSDKSADVQEDSEYESMPKDDLRYVSGLPDHMDHICKEVSSLHSKLGDMESSIIHQVSAEIKSSLPALVTTTLQAQLPGLPSATLKDCLSSIL
ncbi:hypothetical protein Tco_0146170 [Tanacetum coccineum]